MKLARARDERHLSFALLRAGSITYHAGTLIAIAGVTGLMLGV